MANSICGNVSTGLGQGALFTELEWAKKQFIEKLGIDPFPGTLNILLHDDKNKSKWQQIRAQPSFRIEATEKNACDAHCFPVLVGNEYAGAIVLPQLETYPLDQLEIISPLPLRSKLSLQDGDPLTLEFKHPLDANCIIFDLDGTLLDTVDAFYILAKQTGDEFGISMNRSHVYNLLNHGQSYWDAAVPESTPGRQAVIDEMNKRAIQLWPEIMAKHARVFPDIFDTLLTLKNRGNRLGVVTGSGASTVDLLYSAGVEDLFEVVITNADVSRRKPHPDGLLKCLDYLGAEAGDAIYVGDTSIDMQASRAAGMSAVGVLSGAGTSASLCQAGAHRIIQKHSDLITIFDETSATLCSTVNL